MIKLNQISLRRGSKLLLQEANATFHAGQSVALIGANGSGKSSLFQLLLGDLSIDEGERLLPADWRIAHMVQEIESVDRLASDFVMDGDQALRNIEYQLAEAEKGNDNDAIARLHEQMDIIDGYNAGVRAAQLMQGLGFAPDDTNKPVNSFSGGWRIRLNLAQALMCPSELLLLDEPTNHLDIDATVWLERWLQQYRGTLILISHDRDFIDAVSEKIIQIEHQQLHSYNGNYSSFEKQRAEKLAQQQASYEKQQRRIEEIHKFVNRFRAKATKAKQAQSRLKELQRMELIAPAHIDSPFDFSFPEPERFSDPLMNLSQSSLGYNKERIVQGLNLSIHPGSRIGLLGANGAGKSTLLKSLAREIPLVEGDLVEGEHLHIGYFSQHQMKALDLAASPTLHLQRLSPQASEQAIRNFLGGFNFRGDMALQSIENFSGGEKARLALAIVVWQKPNLLLLDEPTNHLDLEMCHALTMALQSYSGALVLVSHDRHLLRNTVDQFLLVYDGKVESFDGDLDSYARWLLTNQTPKNTPEQNNNARTSDGCSETAMPDIAGRSAENRNAKLQRQSAAEKRKLLQPVKKAISDIEKRMEKIGKELASLEDKLSDAAMYENEKKSKLQDLLLQQGALRQENTALEEQWLQKQEELETLNSIEK